ncbi:uncharacterized protein LOC124456495 [Xenia sp. Carnegie-2017]|uniref:uncharacterized protein LOC124456495 n=1 Tax=Xenia sp. Carnegie-2017 TaxID=2897299 RepID=UPI001F04002A|nr:uncharacterized protein LOC124456495 [Xenia sp. Carnegie-2017]
MAQKINITKKEFESIFDAKLKPINDSNHEMIDSVKFLNLCFEEIKQKVENLESSLQNVIKENHSLKQETTRLCSENAKLSNLVKDLSKELNDVQQYERRDCCEITGIPVEQNEVTNNLVIRVGSLMDLKLDAEDISVSHRLPNLNSDTPSKLTSPSLNRSIATRPSLRHVPHSKSVTLVNAPRTPEHLP